MKKLGLGISNANLNKITPGSLVASSAMILFSDDRCQHCKNVEDYITQNNIKSKFNFQELKINNNLDNAKLFTQKIKQCNLASSGVPLFFDGKNCIVGDTDIIAFFQL
jgi:glutaredoxin